MSDYTPRRCSKRWLDGDCPREVLAIIDHGPKSSDRYDVIFTDVQQVAYEGSSRIEKWLQGVSITESGAFCDHFELRAHEVAAYRYRMKHRYARWSDLPEAVKSAVRSDIAAMNEEVTA
jgi:hypothetical protein